MSSSTSSSSAPASSRSTFARILAISVVGMLAAMAIIRLITFLNDVSGGIILARVLEARAALPRIVAEPEPLVMFFGSSMTQAGFSARQFDREAEALGARVKSFNFGFGGLNPFFQDYLALRIREEFDAADRRLELALLEFNPFQTTTSRWNGAQSAIDSFVVMLATPEELWRITRTNPTRGLRMLVIHYLRDDLSAEMITDHFGGAFRPPRPRSNLPENEESAARLRELGDEINTFFEQDYPDYADENWHYGWQGAGTAPWERSEATLEIYREYFEILREPRRMENDKLNRLACCDIEELGFEEELVEAYVRIVRTFQAFSDQVEVVLLPRNEEWIRYSPDAERRLEEVLDRIRSETGVTIRNYQQIDAVTPEMFSDTTHLSRYEGDVAFTSFLVEQYAAGLPRADDAER